MTIVEKAAENILEGVFSVYDKQDYHINTNNNGMLNEESVNRAKERMLRNAVAYLAQDVVTDYQDYPIEDISRVELEVDLVVLKRRELDFLKEVFNQLIKEKYEE